MPFVSSVLVIVFVFPQSWQCHRMLGPTLPNISLETFHLKDVSTKISRLTPSQNRILGFLGSHPSPLLNSYMTVDTFLCAQAFPSLHGGENVLSLMVCRSILSEARIMGETKWTWGGIRLLCRGIEANKKINKRGYLFSLSLSCTESRFICMLCRSVDHGWESETVKRLDHYFKIFFIS